jgi:hypothetical protein
MSTALRLKPLSWESAGSAVVDTALALALAFAAALADCFADVGSFAARWRRADVCSVRARKVDIAASRSSSSRRIGESAKLPAWILPRAVQCDRGPGNHVAA